MIQAREHSPGLLAGALLLALLAGGCSDSDSAGSGATTATELSGPEAVYAADPRIASLLLPCPVTENRYYDRDTTDMLPVLFEKLEKGQLEPLRRAKEELGAMGERAVAPLQRFYERYAGDAFSAALSENALDVAAMNEHPGVRPILMGAVQHPQSSVRQRALTGLLAGHARPEDYELLRERVTGFEEPNLKRSFVRVLALADPERAHEDFLAWAAAGENSALWTTTLPLLAESRSPQIEEEVRDVWPGLPHVHRPYLAAIAARGGDVPAQEFLAEELTVDDPVRRNQAIRACTAAGLWRELVPVLRGDPDPTFRVLAVDGIAAADPWTEEVRGLVAEGLTDSEPTVRSISLKRLAEKRDPEALDRALNGLNDERQALQEALNALIEPVREDEALARRAFGVLEQRFERESHRPLPLRTATFKAMGILPLQEAAAFLRREGLGGEGDEVEGLRAHEWLMIQAGNTGVAGRTYLLAELAEETDPLRRLDLIMAVGSQRDDLARTALLDLIDGNTISPFETLYIAERLTRIGPSHLVAPALRRVFYDQQDGRTRVALQCLLWRWY